MGNEWQVKKQAVDEGGSGNCSGRELFQGTLEEASLRRWHLITDLKEEEKQADIMEWS